MAGKKSKSTSFEDKMIKRYAKDRVKLQEQIVDEAKKEVNLFLSQGIIREGSILKQKLIDEKDENITRTLEIMEKQFKLQNEIFPLAKTGIYDYDRSEQLDDGDQSPFTDEEEALLLKAICVTFMDWHPNIPYLSPLSKCLLLGDYEGMMSLIGDKQGEELQKLLESRDTYLKVPAIFHLVRGVLARNSGESELDWGIRREERSYSHCSCFMKLLELGVDVNARTVLGDTLLFYCVGGKGRGCPPEALLMGEILLQHGLNVNAVNRLGETALWTPIQENNLDAIKLLVAHGIDITIKDNLQSWSAALMAANDTKIQKLFSEQTKLVAERKKKLRALNQEIFQETLSRRDEERKDSKKDTTAGFLKNAFFGVLKMVGVRWRQDDEGDLVTDQGESGTCVVHALTKAAKQSLSEQNLNIDLSDCLASFLSHPLVDEEEGNFPDEFHSAKISSVGEEKLRWPGSVELCIREVSDVKKFEREEINTSKDTKLVLSYIDEEAGPHCVFISGIERVGNESYFGIVNSWGTPQQGDLDKVKVSKVGNVVYEVRARWSPEGCESVCKVNFFLQHNANKIASCFCLLGLLCCEQ